jgi:general secretion pathway protein N
MRRVLPILAVALGALVAASAALVAWAPAELAYRIAGHRLAPMALEGISGSVWNGRAAQWIAHGVALGRIEWRIEPRAALVGHVRGEIAVTGRQVAGTARFERRGDDWRFEAIEGSFPAALLAPALDIPALGLLGTVSLDLASVSIRDRRLATADGRAEWRGIGVRGIAALTLPGIEMRIASTGERALEATVADLGGPLAVEGRLRMADGAFVAEIDLVPREPEPRLEEILKYVGERRPDGGSHLRIEGTLQPVIGGDP